VGERGRARPAPRLIKPRREAAIPLASGRTLGFAEYGAARGRPVLWFHGTPGGSRQIPPMARRAARERGIRLIAVERPGVGASTPHLYPSVRGFTADVAELADKLGLDRFGVVGWSGGGPYVLACAHDLAGRVTGGAVLGGVAPALGDEAVPGGAVEMLARLGPLIELGRGPLARAVRAVVRTLRPLGSQVFDLYLFTAVEGDRRVFQRPEIKAMFLDDLIHASRRHLHAPVHDAVLFSREWGFSLRDIRVPVRFWHGDADPFVPLGHAEHQVGLVPDSALRVLPGAGHLGNLDASEEILETLMAL
jgi:pimeloyl-ACP methyl ester carboxylesterase